MSVLALNDNSFYIFVLLISTCKKRKEFEVECFPTKSADLGCVRLTVFRNKNTWSDDSKRYVWRF